MNNVGIIVPTSGLRYPSRLRWMNRVGITRQQKLWEGWDGWGPGTFDANGTVTVGPAPYIDDALTLAQGLNIDVFGDLVEGYYQSTINNLDLPGNSQTMPGDGSVAWNNLYYHLRNFTLATIRPAITAWNILGRSRTVTPPTTGAAPTERFPPAPDAFQTAKSPPSRPTKHPPLQARVESPILCSYFKDVDRHLILLKGNGMGLTFNKNKNLVLNNPFDQVQFPGEEPVSCDLISGPIEDF